MNEKSKQLLDEIINKITGETISGFLKKNIFGLNLPIRKWSFLNQFMCFLAQTDDARGYQQWKQVGRFVRKGSKAISIFAPWIRDKKITEKDEQGKDNEKSMQVIVGFFPIPVFRYEDTDGKELDYQIQMKSVNPESLPLYAIAESLKISVKVGLTRHGEAGSFSPESNKIRLSTDSTQTFYHELSHGIDMHLNGTEKYDYALGEVVAELSACFISSLFGTSANLAYTQNYIRSWSDGNEHVVIMIIKALERVKAIYGFIENFLASSIAVA
jgi:antirestriction protein ArdC